MSAGSSVTIDQLRASDRRLVDPPVLPGENFGSRVRAFSEFADADFVEFTVGPGDALFIPIYWWHGIQNLDEVSLTAVYFWSQDWRYTWRDLAPKQLPPPGMRADYARDVARRYVVKPARGLMAKVKR